jgi:hypothetical protein
MASLASAQRKRPDPPRFKQHPQRDDYLRFGEVSRPILTPRRYVEHDTGQILDIIVQYAKDDHLQVDLVPILHAYSSFLLLKYGR